MNGVERIAVGFALACAGSPAFAGPTQLPAPVAGVGVGAVLLIGLGYRALKGRITK